MDDRLKALRKKNIDLTKKQIRESVGKDDLIMQAIGAIDDIKTVANKLSSRLRLWYELYLPEASKKIQDHDRFVKTILAKDKKTLIKEMKISDTMGADLNKDDIDAFTKLAVEIRSLYGLIAKLEEYIDRTMQELCPNLTAIAGSLIGAKLIEHAGGLKGLMEMPSSTIQLLGAEKALFRHIRTGARCPKYGLILQHQLVSNAEDKAKAARLLADKLSIATKVDYFKGEYIADKLNTELKSKIR